MQQLYGELDALLKLSQQGVQPDDFLPADVNASTYAFNDLPTGTYYINVSDALGSQLIDNRKVEVAPTLPLFQSVDVIANGNELVGNGLGEWGTSYAVIGSGFEVTDQTSNLFEVEIDPNPYIYFVAAQANSVGAVAAKPFHLPVGLYVENDVAQLIVDGQAIASTNVTGGDKVKWGFDHGLVVLEHNGNPILKDPLNPDLANNLSTSPTPPTAYNLVVSFYGPGKLGFLPQQPLNTNPINASVMHGMCGGGAGSINITENPFWPVTGLSYIVRNDAGGVVAQQTAAPFAQSLTNLTPGDYELEYTYIQNWWWGSQQVVRKKKLTVGVAAAWNPATIGMNISGNSIRSNLSHPGSSPDSRADAMNQLPAGQSGWIDFQIGYAGLQPPSRYRMGGEQGLNVAMNPQRFPVDMVKASFFTLVEDYDGNPATYFITINNRFRLRRDLGGNLSLYNGNNQNPVFNISGYNADYYLNAALSSENDGFYNVLTSYGCVMPITFVRAQRELDGSFYQTDQDGKLYVQYREEYNHNNFHFRVYDDHNDFQGNELTFPPQNFSGYGDNGVELDFNSLPANEFYVLEIINPKKEKWYLRFKR